MKPITFAVLALMAASALAGAGGSPMSVTEQVYVESAGGKVVVRLSAENRGRQPVYVPKAVYEDDELIGPVFDIRATGSGKQVDYIGRKVKRGPITKDDYVELGPGKKKTNSIDITASYAFMAGEHSYKLTYPGGFLPDLETLDAPARLPVMPVTFTFRN